jgi:hypothetical protein
MKSEDKLEVQTLIAHFANSFDLKDWSGLEACLAESVDTDYSDLRGTPPEHLSARAYVEQRRDSLAHLKMHHLCGNVECETLTERSARCRASMVIWRRSESEEFTSHCVYEFELIKQRSGWRISRITQKVLWNEGISSLHRGAK